MKTVFLNHNHSCHQPITFKFLYSSKKKEKKKEEKTIYLNHETNTLIHTPFPVSRVMEKEPRKKLKLDADAQTKPNWLAPNMQNLASGEIVARVKEILFDRPENMRPARHGTWGCYIGARKGVDIYNVISENVSGCYVVDFCRTATGESYAYVCRKWPQANFDFLSLVNAFVDKCKELKPGETFTQEHALPETLSIQRVRLHMREQFLSKTVDSVFSANCMDGIALLTCTRK